MLITVARELHPGETRVALVPHAVATLIGSGHRVVVQPGAGFGASFRDDDYLAAGAHLEEELDRAELVVSVQPLAAAQRSVLPAGAATISFFQASHLHLGQRLIEAAARRDQQLTTLAMDLIPRTSRSQPMDALSSQSLVAGYRGAIVAAGRLRRFFPLNMTSAGTVSPAQIVVLGAGVAGLQAIATCRRLGAVVKGYDVRAAAAEEIRSMGALAIDLGLETLEGAGGYAREMSEERALRQRELLTPFIAAADALITTAAVPGRQAPILVTRAMVEQMPLGSIVVDLAADSGGNVEEVVPGAVIKIGNAQVWGGQNVPAQMPEPASRLYANNVRAVIDLITAESQLSLDFDDDIIAAMCLTHAGQITHPPTAELLAAGGSDE